MPVGAFWSAAVGLGVLVAAGYVGSADFAASEAAGQETRESRMLMEPAEFERRLDEPNLKPPVYGAFH